MDLEIYVTHTVKHFFIINSIPGILKVDFVFVFDLLMFIKTKLFISWVF